MTGSADYFDEMRKPDGGVRDAYAGYCQWFDGQDNALLRRKHAEAETNFRKTGITFNVYGENEAEERLIPFDMVPRVISAAEWRKLLVASQRKVSVLGARSLPVQRPALRIISDRSRGPRTTSASMPSKSISDMPICGSIAALLQT